MIAIIDYGMGNLRSVQKAIEFLGSSATITSSPTEISKADKVILPGVGAFSKAMENLNKFKLLETIKETVAKDTPFLGICLGMQLLLETSEEHGLAKGLGLVAGTVKNFRNAINFDQNLSVPQIGWNYVSQTKKNSLFVGLPEKFQVYFVHSYYVDPQDKQVNIGETMYGINFCSALQKKNLFGVQYHPEKSGEVGLQILDNFIKL